MNLYDVTAETGGTVVMPRSHLAFGTEVADHNMDASVNQPVVPCAFVLPLVGELRTNNVESRALQLIQCGRHTALCGSGLIANELTH